ADGDVARPAGGTASELADGVVAPAPDAVPPGDPAGEVVADRDRPEAQRAGDGEGELDAARGERDRRLAQADDLHLPGLRRARHGRIAGAPLDGQGIIGLE